MFKGRFPADGGCGVTINLPHSIMCIHRTGELWMLAGAELPPHNLSTLKNIFFLIYVNFLYA